MITVGSICTGFGGIALGHAGSTITEILAAARADYEVHKAELVTPDPADPNPGRAQMLDTGQAYTWRTRPIWMGDDGTLRGGDRHVLGVVGKTYTVVQNRQLAELAYRLIDMLPDSPAIDCAGVLNDGRRFFMTVPLPDVVVDPGGVNDVHGRNLVLTTGHDGGHCVQVVNSVVRAVCANTVQAALSESQWRVSIRHTGQFDPDHVSLRSALGLAIDGGAAFEKLATKLLTQPATLDDVRRVHDQLWGREQLEASTRAKTIRATRLERLETIWGSDKNVGAVGSNNWAVLNTFSEYFQHHQRFAGSKRPGARDERATETGGLNTNVHRVARMLIEA